MITVFGGPGRRAGGGGRRVRVLLSIAALVMSLLTTTQTRPATATAPAWPLPGTVSGDMSVHDPSMVKVGSQYLVASTHNQVELRVSDDRINFRRLGPAFRSVPAWWSRFSSSNDVWAPDVSFHNGKYWMYYSVSSFGSNNSGIGLATSDTGQPGTWVDTGAPILTSPHAGYDFNAIDPNLLVDKNGKWWLTFGSFRLGIYMVALDPQTGKPSTTDTRIRHLAQRLHVWPDPVEAPFVYYKDGYYYLFVSFDYCCKGVNSTYSIHVGRSTAPDGPYIDQAGRNMVGDGGTLLLGTHGNWVIGPGGQSVIHDNADNHDLLVYHYYDGRDNGKPKLGINYLGWENGWPYVY